MFYLVTDINTSRDEFTIGTYEDLDKAKEVALDYWRRLFNSDKRDSAIEVRKYVSEEEYDNGEEYDSVEYCLRWYGYSDLSDESLADVYETTDFYDYEMCKEITKRCDKLEEFEASEDWEDLIEECKAYLWEEAVKNESR
jgi:predicted metal-dependent hydrolase